MKRVGFTLIELLLVIAIMGLMGTAAVGGYRAMQRGMEERGVRQNVFQFLRAAYQRAQIDRVPVTVYYWNETLREADAEGFETEIVVGKAVAVRRMGRLSGVESKQKLYDEFGDLRHQSFILPDVTAATQKAFENALQQSKSSIKLYQMDGSATGVKYSLVSANAGLEPDYGIKLTSRSEVVNIPVYYFEILQERSATWKAGSGYGLEFAELQLPHNYIFGSDYSKDTSSPITGEATVGFLPGGSEPSESTLSVSSLRPSASGDLEPHAIN